ncbi:hypothetical protein C8Q80DRAFT_1269538 [Daedaleopsis nitida]|nr:hypothetical protein C8Q80DRAFT_1269538 [Daedaleopsis nitida]
MLIALSEELLTAILSVCEVSDLLICKRVCRRMEHVVRTDTFLQYKIELAINGMADGRRGPDSPGGLPLPERLELLRKHNARFRNGTFLDSGYQYSWQRWPQVANMPTEGWDTHLAFGGSISYVVVKPPQNEMSICAPPFMGGLSGETSSDSMQHWRIPLSIFPSDPIGSVSVDISQELLLICQPVSTNWDIMVHFRRLNQPENPHDAARQPVLCVSPTQRVISPPPDQPRTTISHIQIHGRLVAWVLCVPGTTYYAIEVWDWQAGHVVWRYHTTHYKETFTLLDASHVVLASPLSNNLLVYAFNPDKEFATADSTSVQQEYVLNLVMPSCQDPGSEIQESSIPVPAAANAPFWSDPALRMVLVTLGDNSALFIPYTTIQSLLSPAHATPEPIHEMRMVSWDLWGPRGSLRIPASANRRTWSYRQCYSYGSRVAVFLFDDERESGNIIMYDLNPWAARYARHMPPEIGELAHHKTGLGCLELEEDADGILPHVVFHGSYIRLGLDQAPPILATDHMGFTAVYARQLANRACRFLGSTSYYT